MNKLDLILKELQNLNERVAKIERNINYPSLFSDLSNDPILVDVINFLIDKKEVGASDLQRKFDIGYARSARILDELMALGYIDRKSDGKAKKTINTEKFKNIKSPTPKAHIKDPLLIKAIDVIVQFDRASASLLQRRLAIGYARAAKLLDELEAHGYVSSAIGSLPRIVNKQHDKN